MKRWQDRGEVEDSEGDEDLSLDADSPSPERPHKRAKQTQNSEIEKTELSTIETVNHQPRSDDEDEGNWTQAKVATTYGRRGKTLTKTSAPNSRRQTPKKRTDVQASYDDHEIIRDAGIQTPRLPSPGLVPDITQPQSHSCPITSQSSACVTEKLQSSQTNASQADQNDVEINMLSATKQIVQPQLSASVLLRRPLLQDANLAREADPAPDEHPVTFDIDTSAETHDHQGEALLPSALPMLPNEDFMRLSDLLSSPLSERDVSPPLGILPPRTDSSAVLNEVPDALNEDESLSGNIRGLTTHELILAANERRSLRARKEKQLHPYMYEKAQYQKQFRERGLKPVRVVEQANNEETQSIAPSTASQDSEASRPSPSSASQALRPPNPTQFQLDYFDADGGSSDDDLNFAHRSTKRRKVEFTYQTRPGRLPSRLPAVTTIEAPDAIEQYSVPPSPPRTSSETGTPSHLVRKTGRAAPGFRLPLGRVYVPPTPQISSDIRPQNFDPNSLGNSPTASMSEAPRHGSGTSSPALSSSESEDEKSRAEAMARRLRRERKRIKGVLPASWLRIDFQRQRAQRSASPIERHRLRAEPSPGAEPQKGLARKIIAGRPRRDSSPALVGVGGHSDDSDDSAREPNADPKQSRLVFEDNQFSVHSTTAAMDDEEMESDFVDPMLPGILRPERGRRRASNQPRITDAFHRTQGLREGPSDHRVSRGYNATDIDNLGFKQRKCRSRTLKRPHVARLSIVDAPKPLSDTEGALPQFVRIALRRARREPNRARHSPADKIVRLATIDDTEEASSVLRAWREGTIAPRRSHSTNEMVDQPPRGSVSAVNDNRVPLRTLPANAHPQRKRGTGPVQPAASTARSRKNSRPGLKQRQVDNTALEERAIEEGPHGSTHHVTPSRRPEASRISLQNARLRHGQLETLEKEFDEVHRSVAFERRMRLLTESVALPDRLPRLPDFQLARYLGAGNTGTSNQNVSVDTTGVGQTSIPILPHRSRKSTARRLETSSRQYRQPSEPLPDWTATDEHSHAPISIAGPVLEGLGPFGTRYSKDFGIEPLVPGTFFQHTTFIGSGELSDALSLSRRDLSCATGRMRVQLDGEILEWGGWNEDVAANFTRIPRAISEALQTLEPTDQSSDQEQIIGAADSNIDYLLRSIVRFCSKCLFFADSVDRLSCAEGLHRLVVDLVETFAEPLAIARASRRTITKALQYGVIIAKQASQICDHPVVSTALTTKIDNLLLRTAKELAKFAVVGRFGELRSFYEDNRHASKLQIDDDVYTLSSIVILNSTRTANEVQSLLWPAICSTMGRDISQTCAVGILESLWYDIFTLLPALELTATGTVSFGSRLVRPQEDWSLPQAMLSRTFELYEASSDVRGYSVNDYMRSLLSRCFTLVNKWSWWRCESVLNVIYDFFSRRGLSLLKKEDSRGSPRFLDSFGSGLVELDVQNDDRSFHIFLKILASGLLGMGKHQLYSYRKIQGIAWRFIPNHNRTYRKDVDVERSALDSLRNHHDLICTLYYASPPGHRPGVHLLRGLVDHATSHREACRLNVRSWANIASLQASTTESVEVLRPLTSWYADVMETTMAQYRLARSEAQQAFDQAKIEGADPSEALLESIVTNNQRQLAATIVDALAGLKRVLASASGLAVAVFMVQTTAFWTVLELFDPCQRRLIGAITEALNVVETALDVVQESTPTPSSQHGSDDSQDFGDFDALQEFAANEQTAPVRTSIVEILLGPIGQFMSNALGADVAPDDNLLQQSINVWVRLAGMTVANAQKSWLSYVDDYSATGWGQLRDTAQKRKFTTYFMSRVVEQPNLNVDISQHVVTAWLLSLVEREALLKHQHMLTSSLLNHLDGNCLLQNLPFARNSQGDFHVTLGELRQRRLALISSVLCNMREDHERAAETGLAQGVRMVHEGMLRQLMQAMKSNYQELQTCLSELLGDAGVQSAYVEFVHQVVSLLQQHTAGICKVDAFFTDPNVFPLPSDDPAYVVGRLKGYVPKLRDPPTRKQLAAFVQSVSERAAIDGQQSNLVNQMVTAMGGVTEKGNITSPSLRYLLLTTLFPAYIDNAFATPCFWILLLPILQACEQAIPDLLYSVKIEDHSSVVAGAESTIAVLHCINRQFEKVLSVLPESLGCSHVLRTLSAMLRVGTACLTLVSFIKRATSQGDQLMKQVRTLRALTFAIEACLNGSTAACLFEASMVSDLPVCPWPDTKTHVEARLQVDVNPYWYSEHGNYYWKRHNRTQEIVMSLQGCEEERRCLEQVIVRFRRAYDATFSVKARRRMRSTSEGKWMDNVIV